MYRRAARHPKVPALWRGTPLPRRAPSSQFAAPRPIISCLTKQSAHTHKYLSNKILARSLTGLVSMDDPSLDPIRSHMTCTEFVDSVWGFAIYRCAGTEESAWQRMMQLINDSVRETLTSCGQEDLLNYHDLHVADERPSQDSHGATSHQVRDLFNSWVSQSLASRLPPNSAMKIDDFKWKRATFTPRYEYCLFVDSLCLESLDQPGPYYPVVKMLRRDWTDDLSPQERQSALVYPGFHDGVTEYHEEDVGWIYMPVVEYVERYAMLHNDQFWEITYTRPPYILDCDREDELPGSWRRG